MLRFSVYMNLGRYRMQHSFKYLSREIVGRRSRQNMTMYNMGSGSKYWVWMWHTF